MLALSATYLLWPSTFPHISNYTYIYLSPPSQGFLAKNSPTQVWLAFFAPGCTPVLSSVLMRILLHCLSWFKWSKPFFLTSLFIPPLVFFLSTLLQSLACVSRLHQADFNQKRFSAFYDYNQFLIQLSSTSLNSNIPLKIKIHHTTKLKML